MSDSVRPHRWQPTRLPRPWDSPGKNTGVGCHFLLQCMKVKVKSLSRVPFLVTPWTAAYQAPASMGFSRQEYWSDVYSCHILFDHFQFALIHGPNIPGSQSILLFTASDFASITSHIHNWVLFLLWSHLFILSGVISPLISSSILKTY